MADTTTLAEDPATHCFLAVPSPGTYTAIVERTDQQPLAWYPDEFSLLRVHPSSSQWAGVTQTHLSIFSLQELSAPMPEQTK